MTLAQGAPTPFSTNVENMWFKGSKDEVLALANARLKTNSNDIAGLLLTLEYQMDFSDIAHLRSTIDKIIVAGANIKTANFAKVYPALKDDLTNEEANVLPNITPAMATAEASKGNISGKPMIYLNILQAAELDGLVH